MCKCTKGRFFNNQNARSFAVCTPDYYRKAKKKLEDKKLKDLIFFVFSDDINSCIIANILSNSTFSWWGQFLSTSKNKLVVSPSRWNNDGYQSQLIQKDWILINC